MVDPTLACSIIVHLGSRLICKFRQLALRSQGHPVHALVAVAVASASASGVINLSPRSSFYR